MLAIAGGATALQWMEKKGRSPIQAGQGAPAGLAMEGKWNLILVLSSGCRPCEDSAPFYSRVVRSAGSRVTVVVAGSDQDLGLSAWVRAHRIAAARVVLSKWSELKVPVTPSVLLVKPDGTVHGTWFGLLSSKGQEALELALNAVPHVASTP